MKRSRSRVVLIGLSLAGVACGAPELTIDFRLPEPYRDVVGRVELQIFTPSAAAPFTCEDLAFQRVDPAVVALSRVKDLSSSGLEAPFSELDRRARKIFVADGEREDGRRLVTGCAELGEVRGAESLEIRGEPVPMIDPGPPALLSGTLGTLPTPRIILQVSDALGAPLPGVPAEYVVDGAGGPGAFGSQNADDSGRISITPNLPDRPGPFVLDVRVRWAKSGPIWLPGFLLRPAEVVALPGRTLDFRSGRVGPMAEPGFVALSSDGRGSSRALLVFEDGRSSTRKILSTPPVAGSPLLGLIEDSAGGRDRAILVSRDAWSEVTPEAELLARPTYSRPAQSGAPRRVLARGGCRPEEKNTRGAFVELEGGMVGEYSDEGALVDAFSLSDDPTFSVELLASGCISNQDGSLERTLAVGVGSGIGVYLAIFGGPDDFLLAPWFALPSAIAFAPRAEGRPGWVFGTQLDVNDIVVSRATIERRADDAAVRIQGLDPVPAVPISIAAGDIDGDGQVDVLSLVRQSDEAGLDHLILSGTLGREHARRRVTGDVDLGPLAPTRIRAPTLLVVDLDRDGVDDVLIAETSPSASGTESRLELLRMSR